MSDKVTGGCLCGAVRYEAGAAPRGVHFCHCRMCQRAFGSPFGMYGAVPADKLSFTSGAPKIYGSSSFAERGFCPNCGSQLTFRYLKSDRIGISIGSLDQPERVVPEIHWGIESRISWSQFDDGLPQKRTEDDPEFCACAGDPRA